MKLQEWEKIKSGYTKKANARREERINHGLDDGEPRYIFTFEEMIMELYEKMLKIEELLDPKDPE